MAEPSKYIVNPGPKTPVTGLKAAVTSDSAIVTETIMKVLSSGGNAADAVIAGAMVQAAVEHMGSFSVIARDEASDTYTAIADPRRCAVADGIKE